MNENFNTLIVSSQPNYLVRSSNEYLDEAMFGLNVDFRWRRASSIEMLSIKCFLTKNSCISPSRDSIDDAIFNATNSNSVPWPI